MAVRTNNVPRDVIYWHELTDAERNDLDYRDTEESQADFTGFRYRGNVYDLAEFMRAPNSMKPWDGYHTDSFFSAVVIRFPRDYSGTDTDHVIVGVWYE